MQTKRISGILLMVAVVMMMSSVAHGAALLSDNFEVTPQSSDINANLAARQAGTLANTSYVERTETAVGGPVNHLTTVSGWLEITCGGPASDVAWVSPNANLISQDNFKVSVEMWPCTYVSTGNYEYDSYVAIGAPKGYTTGGAGLAFGLTGDDHWYMLDNGVAVAGGAIGTPANPWNTRTYPTFNTVSIDWNKIGSDYYASVSVQKDGKFFSAVQNYKVQTPITENYVTLGTHGSPGGVIVQSYWDNLMIETIPAQVPEPGSMLALVSGLIGLGAMIRRRY